MDKRNIATTISKLYEIYVEKREKQSVEVISRYSIIIGSQFNFSGCIFWLPEKFAL